MKPKKMYAFPNQMKPRTGSMILVSRCFRLVKHPQIPLLLVPLDAESVEELRKKAKEAARASFEGPGLIKAGNGTPEQIATAVLAAIGITAPRRKKR